MKSQFKSFGEGLGIVRNKIDELGDKVEKLDNKVEKLDNKVEKLDNKVEKLDFRVEKLEIGQEVLTDKFDKMQEDITEIKHKLSQKVDLEDFQKLEKRVIKLEKLIVSAV
jgi:chromosome segregation ATPase